MKRLSLLIFLILVGFCSANSVARFNLDLSSNLFQTANAGQFYSDSILIEIITNQNAICKYSSLSGIPFESMEGTFDRSGNSVHQKTIIGQTENSYRYYVKCQLSNGSISQSELELNYNIYIPVSAQIILSGRAPLKSGDYEVTLITSRELSQKPILQYSVDGIVYTPIPLFGSDKIWKGYFIIPKSLGEVVGSFKFEGVDLSGRKGDKIEGESIFLIDTIKPETITTARATGMEGQIRLEWYYDKDSKFNIYKSTSPNPDYTFFYKNTDSDHYVDTDVEKGKTYYYKIAPVDEAGNIADLSKEIKATALIENVSTSSGLSLELTGYVDNFLTEISLVMGDIKTVKESITSKEAKEKELFEIMKLNKQVDDTQSELNFLKNDVEKYKLQTLNKEELDKKLSSSQIKLNIIKGKIPEDLIIREENKVSIELGDELYSYIISEYMPDMTEKERKESLKQTKNLVEEYEPVVESNLAAVEIVYLDGTKKEKTLIYHTISSEIDNSEQGLILVSLPFDLASKPTDVTMLNLNYDTPKESAFFSFSVDTKKIVYLLDQEVDKDLLKEIKISPVVINDEIETVSGITGYSIIGENKTESAGVVVLILVIIGLSFYFVRVRKKKSRIPIMKKIDEMREAAKKGNDFSKEYEEVKMEYKRLNKEQKEVVYKELKKIIRKK